MNKRGKNGHQKRLQTRHARGDVKMPKMTREELALRIEMVARKAESIEQAAHETTDTGVDVIRSNRSAWYVKARRVG